MSQIYLIGFVLQVFVAISTTESM